LSEFEGQKVHALAAIGNPKRFFDSLRGQGLEVIEHPFPDHHPLTAADLDFNDSHPILMTEKDAVKCLAFAKAHHWKVPVDAKLPDSFFDAIDLKLRK